MKTVILSMTMAIMIVAVGCGQDNNKKQVESKEVSKMEDAHDHGGHHHGNSSAKKERVVVGSLQNSNATTAVVNAYLHIKNALVEDNKQAAAKGGKELLTAFLNFDTSKLIDSQQEEYSSILESAKEQAEHIVKSPIDHQREHFEALSTDIHDLITLLGTDRTLYKDYCPMASGGKGAIWLSEIKGIENPFFGSKMLNCGEVQEQIIAIKP